MELLTLNCRGPKIQIDESVINNIGAISAYWDMVKENKMMETKQHEYYINCSAETMHELLDLILANNFITCDLKIYQLAQFLCVDVEFRTNSQGRRKERK